MGLAHQLQRGIIDAAASPAARSCGLFPRRFLISPPPPPQSATNGVLRSYNGSRLQSSSLFLADESDKSFHIMLEKIKISCELGANQSRVLSFNCERPKSFINFSSWPLIRQSLHKVLFPRSLMPVNVFGSGLRAHCPDTSSRRSFSHVPRAIGNKKEDSFRDKRTSKATSLSAIDSKSKQKKALAVQNRNAEGVTQVGNSVKALGMAGYVVPKLPPKDSCITNPGRQLVQDGIADVSIGQSSSSSPVFTSDKVPNKGKHKHHSRNKKRNVRTPGPSGFSDEAHQPCSTDKVSQAKKSSSTKKARPLPAPENSSGTMPSEVLNVSSLKGQQSESTATRPIKRVKAAKEDINLVKGHGGAQVLSNNQLAHKQKRRPHGKGKPQGQRTMPSLYPPTGKSVLIVESVTKAKLIQGYLGNMFEVLPSYGHVRDLAARSGSVRPDDNFSMVWEVPSAAWSHLKSITVALTGANNLILASDPDREGEAIAWHIIEMLRQQDALREDVVVARVVFNEITESSIKNALKAPRHINENMVHAYLARRALDYLIGFNIAPLLWKKLPGCQSAGRVQSAAMALICDREMEIEKFKPQEYWKVYVKFRNNELDSRSDTFSLSPHLIQLSSKRLNQLSISSETDARSIEQSINSSKFKVVGSKSNKVRKNPPNPYITSTLQQDAANKLHFTATYTMKLAQKLYEGVQMSDGNTAGLITYMRTDGLHISDEATKGIRGFVIQRYGENFASDSSHKYFRKVKNSPEVHEAIRPTDIQRLPSLLVGSLDEDSLRLYALIWARTVACQMKPAVIDHIQVDIGNHDQSIVLRSACSGVKFPGFQAVYQDLEAKAIRYNENKGNDHSEAFKVLSQLKKGRALFLGEVKLEHHHTQPPARFSEGALVKKLEELGIGRPSTYASIIKVLQDRKYVTIKNRVLYPEFRGRMVSAFLSHHFSEVTDYSFTADMEAELDNVSAGLTEWKGLLGDYWERFSKYCKRAATVDIPQVEKMLEKRFTEFLFASLPDKDRTCPSCSEGELTFKVSRFGVGYFIGCNQHPKCKYIAKTLFGGEEEEFDSPESSSVEKPKLLGHHPQSKEKILLKSGPYGSYVQLGEDRNGYLPKRVNLMQIKDVKSITLEDALEFLRYPVTLGVHPKDGRPVVLMISKGFFKLRHANSTVSVPKKLKPSEINMDKAVKLLNGPDVSHSGRPSKKDKVENIEDIY